MSTLWRKPTTTAIRSRSSRLWLQLGESTAGRGLVTLLALVCLGLAAIHPALFGSLPRTDDGELHLYRLVALDHAIQQGSWWPRYVPGMAFGYGMPVFNYYSPLSLYPMELLHLAGTSFLDAFLAGLVVYTLFGLVGAYLLGKAWGGPLAGLVTAAAYAYAPYTLVNWPRRGAIAEFLGLALLVWALWAFRRLSQRGGRLDFVLAAGFFSLLLLTHNITALYGTALLAGCSLLLWWISPDPPRTFWRLALALVLPLGLTAFYWVPALFETGYVLIDRVSMTGSRPTFWSHFAAPGQIFSLPFTADLTRIRTEVPISIGWAQMVLALLGVGLIAARSGEDDPIRLSLRRWLLFAAPLIPLLIFLMTRASGWLWETIPLLSYLQFPWRMLGPLTVLLVVLAGGGAALVARRIAAPPGQAVWLGAVLLSLIISGMPWLYGLYLPRSQTGSILDVHSYERRTGHIGGTASGEYLPRWVKVLPDPDRLAGLYARSDVIPRLQPTPGVTVQEAAWGASSAALTITASQETTLVFDWLYFPGWWARLDGEPVPILPTDPNGFVSTAVPPGKHLLELGFGPTPLRRAASIISLLALAAAAGLIAAPRRWLRIWQAPGSQPAETAPWRSVGWAFAVAALAGLLAFGLKAAWIDNANTPIKRARFAGGIESGLQTPVMASMGEMITLLGFDLPRAGVTSGGTAGLTLYWALSDGMIAEDLSSVVMIRDAEQNIIMQTLSFYPAGEPTTTWLPGFYVQEPFELAIPPGTPPGLYTIQVGMYSHILGRNLDVRDAQDNPTGILIEIALLTVGRPRQPLRPASLPASSRLLNADVTDDLRLVSASEPPAAGEVGEPFPLVWYWQALRRPVIDYQARLLWLDEGGETAARSRQMPLAAGYPTDQWRRRDLWRGLHMLHVPGSLEAGRYTVVVQVYGADGEPVGEQAVIGEMVVSTPPRRFELPPLPVAADVDWENGIRLVGYDLPDTTVRQGDGLPLTLIWQPRQEVMESLTVFVHLIDAEGQIATQRDQIPASGRRPTTGWAPGEVVSDGYALRIGPEVAPGAYRLRVGWYNATTGERIRLADGAEFWLLPHTVTVRR